MEIAIIAGCSTVAAGFILYKVLPETYAFLKSTLGKFFYKTTIISISQNRIKLIKMVQYVNSLEKSPDIDTVRLCIDKVEYVLPLTEIQISDRNTGYSFYVKFNIDNLGNLVNMHVYTYKRFLIFITNSERISAFDTFINSFPCDISNDQIIDSKKNN